MTKLKKTQEKEYKPSKWIYVLLFTIPLVFITMLVSSLDNDLWYLLSEGRYIVQNGIFHIDPLSMHEGLEVVVQNWMSASFFWIIYDWFGEMGIFTIMLLVNILICIMLYKLCMTISDDNYVLSLLLMFATDVTLLSHYIVSRPQIFSFVTLISLLYVLEKYIKTDNWKYLIWIPVISLIQINMHASLWLMLFLFMLPYVIDAFGCKFLRTQGYHKKPLFIAIAIAAVVGLINPYGYKAITFIFTSFGNATMHNFINELQPFNIRAALCQHVLIIAGVVGLIMSFFREGNVRVRYICLFSGTLILGFSTVKALSHFIVVSMFPLAYFFKDICPKDFRYLPKVVSKIFNYGVILISCAAIGLLGFFYSKAPGKVYLRHGAEDALNVLAKSFDPKTTTVYSSFNDGGTVEFFGFKPYIDPRAEYFLKSINKKADIFQENYDLQTGQIDIEEFLEKYNFTHLLIHATDRLASQFEYENYFVIYESTDEGYRLYARNDLFTDKDRKDIIDAYTKAKKEAEEKNNPKVENTNTNTNTKKKKK